MTEIDWPTYTSELLTLLDLIEMETNDETTAALARTRFDIIVRHGFTIERGAPASGRIQ